MGRGVAKKWGPCVPKDFDFKWNAEQHIFKALCPANKKNIFFQHHPLGFEITGSEAFCNPDFGNSSAETWFYFKLCCFILIFDLIILLLNMNVFLLINWKVCCGFGCFTSDRMVHLDFSFVMVKKRHLVKYCCYKQTSWVEETIFSFLSNEPLKEHRTKRIQSKCCF